MVVFALFIVWITVTVEFGLRLFFHTSLGQPFRKAGHQPTGVSGLTRIHMAILKWVVEPVFYQFLFLGYRNAVMDYYCARYAVPESVRKVWIVVNSGVTDQFDDMHRVFVSMVKEEAAFAHATRVFQSEAVQESLVFLMDALFFTTSKRTLRALLGPERNTSDGRAFHADILVPLLEAMTNSHVLFQDYQAHNRSGIHATRPKRVPVFNYTA